MKVVRHDSPHREVIAFFDDDGRIDGVLSHELEHSAATIKPLNSELIVKNSKNDVVVLRLNALVDQQSVSLINTDTNHAVATDAKNMGCVTVPNEMLVQVNTFACVISGWRAKPSGH